MVTLVKYKTIKCIEQMTFKLNNNNNNKKWSKSFFFFKYYLNLNVM